MRVLELSTKSGSAIAPSYEPVQKDLVAPIGPSSSTVAFTDTIHVRLVELEELESMSTFPNEDGIPCAITVRELPAEDHASLDLQISSIIYNYALTYFLGCVHRAVGQTAVEERVLRGTKKLFKFARNAVFKTMNREQTESGMESTQSLHVANLVLSGILSVCRLQNDIHSIREAWEIKRVLEDRLSGHLVLGNICQECAAKAA